MRNVLPFLTLAAALAAGPALAQQEKQPGIPVRTLDQTPEKRINDLFAQLKKTGNAHAAEQVANRITDRWAESGSASIDLMMGWAKEAMEKEKYDVALDFLDQAATMRPAYAEAYFRRATVHFQMNNYEKSMVDIEKTLSLEPRHFEALAALARLMQQRGLKESALAIYMRVLDVYPAMRNAQTEATTLAEDLEPRAL